MRKILSSLAAALDTIRRAREAQANYEILSRKTDRQLADMGITRSDVIQVAYQKAYAS